MYGVDSRNLQIWLGSFLKWTGSAEILWVSVNLALNVCYIQIISRYDLNLLHSHLVLVSCVHTEVWLLCPAQTYKRHILLLPFTRENVASSTATSSSKQVTTFPATFFVVILGFSGSLFHVCIFLLNMAARPVAAVLHYLHSHCFISGLVTIWIAKFYLNTFVRQNWKQALRLILT